MTKYSISDYFHVILMISKELRKVELPLKDSGEIFDA
jgi:hypothetical protein